MTAAGDRDPSGPASVTRCGARMEDSWYAQKDYESTLDSTWIVSTAIFVPMSLCLAYLGFLERPLNNESGVEKTRQQYVCSALFLEATAILVRSVWFGFKVDVNSPHTIHGVIILGVASRVSECVQYASCLVIVWQWALLCARILNWDSAALSRFYYIMLTYFILFMGFYLGTAPYSYDPRVTDKVFKQYDDLVIGAIFTSSAAALLFFSHSIKSAIDKWSAINKAAGGGSAHIIRSAASHTRRLYVASWAMALAYLVRAVSWSLVVFGYHGSSPWFYPLCFFQIPMTVIAVSTMCIVGNADRRLSAAWQWLNAATATERTSFNPGGANMRVSYAQPQAVGRGGESEMRSSQFHARASHSNVSTIENRV